MKSCAFSRTIHCDKELSTYLQGHRELLAHEIYTEICSDLGLSENAATSTNIQIVRKVIIASVTEVTRKQIESRQRHRIYETKSRNNLDVRRTAFMKEEGMVVFSPEQFARLLVLRKEDSRVKKGQHCNNEILAAILNEEFQTTIFTVDNCRQKFANYNIARKKREARLQELGITEDRSLALELRTDVLRQLNDSIAVAPLVVIPPEDLGKILSLDHGESGIDNATVTVSDNIMRDNGTILYA